MFEDIRLKALVDSMLLSMCVYFYAHITQLFLSLYILQCWS